MADDGETDTSAARPVKNGRFRWLKLVTAVALAAIIIVWLGFWIQDRWTHVSSSDARVTTNEVTVASRLAGRITGFEIRRGDRLRADQLVAQLYSEPDQLELSASRARVNALQAKLTTQQSRLQAVKDHLAGGIAENKDLLHADIASRNAAKARMIKARKSAKRSQRLFQNNSISEQERDLDRYSYQAAQADYEEAKQQVKLDRQALDNARTGLLTKPPMTLPSPSVLKSKRTETQHYLAQAKAQLSKQQTRLADLSVTSPIAGVVDKTFIESGEYVSAGQPIVMMHDPQDVWIQAKIKETKINALHTGQPVMIHVDARPDADYAGHVAVIGHAATSQFALLPNPNPSGNFTKITQRIPVRIAIDKGAKSALSPGMMVEIAVAINADSGDTTRSGSHSDE